MDVENWVGNVRKFRDFLSNFFGGIYGRFSVNLINHTLFVNTPQPNALNCLLSRWKWEIIVLVLFSVFSNFEKIRYCLRFVCPSDRLSVDATAFHGVGRLGSFMAQSIAYDPRTWTKEGIFFGPVLDPTV